MPISLDAYLAERLDEEARTAVTAEVERQMKESGWQPHVEKTPERATVVTRPVELNGSTEHPQVTQLMTDNGLSPDAWVCVKSEPRYYEGHYKDADKQDHVVGMYALRLVCEPKVPPCQVLIPDLITFPLKPWQPPAARKTELPSTRRYLVTSDPQIPWHDEALHQLTCRMANDIQADGWFELGDFLDLPGLSHYRPKRALLPGEREFHASLNESLQTGCRVAWERTCALPGYAEKHLVPGNHDKRVETYQLDHAEALYGVRAAAIGPYESYPALDLFRLMHLPEMGWNCHRSDMGGYPYADVEIAPGLFGIHGTVAKGRAGKSIAQELEERTHSVIQAHCNKLSMITRVRADQCGRPLLTIGIEDGMLGQIRGGMDFAPRTVNNWIQGLVVVTVYPNDEWAATLVPYFNGAIRFEGSEWRNPVPDGVSATSETFYAVMPR